MIILKKNILFLLFLILFSRVYSYSQLAYGKALSGEKNLAGENLSGANLSRRGLKDRNFEGTNLEGANLSGANLEGANLSGANLEGANLSGANLEGANPSGANLEGANFSGANLEGANLSGANLKGANLSGANLEGSNFGGANLNQTNFDKSKMVKCNLKGASLEGATFDESSLIDVDFSNAKLGGSIEVTVKIGSSITAKKILKTKFFNAKFKNVYFKNAQFDIKGKSDSAQRGGTKFKECEMDHVVFDGSTVKKLDIVNCNLKICSFKDLKLETLGRGNTSFYLENNKLDNCSFSDSTFENKYDMYNMPKNIMLRTSGLSKKYIRMLKEKGAHIPGYSIICNADLHEDLDKDERPCKRKLVKEMIKEASNKKNNVIAVVYPGDLCRWGNKDNWKSFITQYFDKLKKHVKKQFLCSGNHDRWHEDKALGDYIHAGISLLKGDASYAIGKIKKQNDQKHGYYKYFMNGTDFVSLDECPTFPNNKPIDWFKDKIAKLKSPKILFFHDTVLSNWSLGWWTQKDEPRPTNLRRGKEAVNSFYNKIKKYKDKIILQITGHDHRNMYKNWRGIPTVCVGGDCFVLAHIDINFPKKINGVWKIVPEVVAIEFIHPANKVKTFYPCMEFDTDGKKREFILEAFVKILERSPKSSEIRYYIQKWKEIGGIWEIKQKLKTSIEFIKLKINDFYKRYLDRKSDASGLTHYVKIWKTKGKNEVEKRIKNSKEARKVLLKKWYKDYLDRDINKNELQAYLDGWTEINDADAIEKKIRNSEEARPKLLKKWYKEFLEKDISDKELKKWLKEWNRIEVQNTLFGIGMFHEDKFGYKIIRDMIRISPQSKLYQNVMFGQQRGIY